MPSDFTVLAIIAAYNEADIIDAVVRDLIEQDISVYFIDDGSTDGTVEAVEPHAGRGVIQIERLRPTVSERSSPFNWQHVLQRKAQLASELDADWFIHHDADELRESPWADVPLKEAIRRVDAMGYNAIDFASLDFRPTNDQFNDGDDLRASFPFYSDGAAYDKVQIRCWKKTDRVDLASTGGHEVRFEGRKVFPIRFLLRHYPIRGQAHGERKVFAERQPRFVEEERARGWHVQYDGFVKGATFVHDPCTLTRFDPVDVRIGLSLRHRGVEALEQSLDSARSEVAIRTGELHDVQQQLAGHKSELHNVQAELTARIQDLAGTHAQLRELDAKLTATREQLAHRTSELDARRVEVQGLNHALEQQKTEIANLRATVKEFLRQLDDFRQSLSWRVMAPARAVLRLLRGR